MANVVEYAKYYRNINFHQLPFNEVDALILADLSYLNFDGCIKELPMSIEEIANIYFSKMTKDKIKGKAKIYRDSHNLFNALKSSNRFKEILITDYQKVITSDAQFGGITFRTRDWVYISFEGTNSYLSGWKEDCHLSHQFPIPSQILAKEYINRNIKNDDETIYIGGHSKGANLAIAGAFMSDLDIRTKITTIYDFDGPGLREKEFLTEEYKGIKSRIKKYVPNHSIVGMLMYSEGIFKTVNSTSKSILQHNLFSWSCFGGFFVEDSLSNKSVRFSKSIKEFVKEYSEDDMAKFVETLFQIFKRAGIHYDEEIDLKKLAKCITSLKNAKMDKPTKEKTMQLFNMLIELHK